MVDFWNYQNTVSKKSFFDFRLNFQNFKILAFYALIPDETVAEDIEIGVERSNQNQSNLDGLVLNGKLNFK